MVSPEGASDPAYERLVRKVTLENLWIYVLSLLRSGPKYGYEIRDLIRAEYGFEPGKVSAYVVIYKLAKGGYISPKAGGGRGPGPPRKYYEITEKGIELLERGLRFLEETLDRLRAGRPPQSAPARPAKAKAGRVEGDPPPRSYEPRHQDPTDRHYGCHPNEA